jgi:lon-related putative ATP-dependent protease
MVQELAVEKLRQVCPPSAIDCETSENAVELKSIVGQERAVKALKFGLGIQEKGFNIYVSGQPGTGRTTAVENFLEDVARTRPSPSDWVYVNNFQDNYRPRALRFPSGNAKEFQKTMKSLAENALTEIQNVFESEEYSAKKDETLKNFQKQKEDLFNKVNQEARQEDFMIRATPMGLMAIPMKNNEPMTNDEFMALSESKREELSKKQEKLQNQIESIIRQSRGVDRSAAEALEELDKQIGLYAIQHLFDEVIKKYEHLEDVVAYLNDVKADILEHLSDFKAGQEQPQQTPFPMASQDPREAAAHRYEVNVLVDNDDKKGAPVLVEMNPTYNNLFGVIEHEAQFGTLVTDFSLLRGGSLHSANGGFLVMSIEDVLRNPFAYDSLKRALANNEIDMESPMDRLGYLSTRGLRPEPIPLEIKVILIGQPRIFMLLQSVDDQFRELFKVKADFDTRMERNDEHIQDYVGFIGNLCRNENLKHLDCSAIAKIVEHGSRLAENQEKLTTNFGDISDVIREASFYAVEDGTDFTQSQHVQKAIDERYYRSSLIQERIGEMIAKDIIKIDVDGEKVGLVNGLSVISMPDFEFGQPSRISASVGMGREGLVDIEREAELSGPIHTKGFLILSGYLNQKYAREKPLSLSARLVFEQSYSGVDGDSASSTELYALLSELSNIPIKQGIAVTGSVNQKGVVQAIGGVNQKIEGFFEVCKAKGITGEQGVMIPESNVDDLMLKEEVVEAVDQGKFHIWPVKSIDEGIEILTGVKAGDRLDDGCFEEDSVHARVDQRLLELAEKYAEFGRPAEKK